MENKDIKKIYQSKENVCKILSGNKYAFFIKDKTINFLFSDKITPDFVKSNEIVRENIIRVSLFYFQIFGFYPIIGKKYSISPRKLFKKKKEKSGIYDLNNFPKISEIFYFLKRIEMTNLLTLLLLFICLALKLDKDLKELVTETGALKSWMKFSSYLESYADTYNIDKINENNENVEQWNVNWEQEKDFPDIERLNVSSYCGSIGGLNWTGQSCYQDSVYMALFSVPNQIIYNNLLNKNLEQICSSRHKWTECNKNNKKDLQIRREIQNELKEIYKTIRGEKTRDTCSNIRNVMKKCISGRRYVLSEQRDAVDFLKYLFDVFQFDVATFTLKVELSENGEDYFTSSERVMSNNNPIIDITGNILSQLDYEGYNSLEMFMEKSWDVELDDENARTYNGKQYRFVRNTEIFTSPYIIFNVNRIAYITSSKKTYISIPEEEIETEDDEETDDEADSRDEPWDNFYNNLKKEISGEVKEQFVKTNIISPEKINNLELTAIIVWAGNHYTCYFKCNKLWFFYNDLSSGGKYSIEMIGSYRNLFLKNNPHPKPNTNGTLYFYT